MKMNLRIIGVISTLFGGWVLFGSKSASREIIALISFLIAVVSLGSRGIIEAIEKQGTSEDDDGLLKTPSVSYRNSTKQKKATNKTHVTKPRKNVQEEEVKPKE